MKFPDLRYAITFYFYYYGLNTWFLDYCVPGYYYYGWVYLLFFFIVYLFFGFFLLYCGLPGMTQLTRKSPIALRIILRGSPGPTA